MNTDTSGRFLEVNGNGSNFQLSICICQ